MWKEIIFTDVTRMGGDRVCIAGVDHKAVTIRPDVGPQGVREHHLYQDNRVIVFPRAVVSLQLEPLAEPEVPHIEDYTWLEPHKTELLRRADDHAWRRVLQRTGYASVSAIFEAPLHDRKRVEPGTGVRSLGTIRPTSIDRFFYGSSDQEPATYRYRLSFHDPSGEAFVNLSITDLSLRYYANYLHLDQGLSQTRSAAILEDKFKSLETWLRLGLSRPWIKPGEEESWCYIQVTGVYTFPDYLNGACFADFTKQHSE